MGLNTKCPIHGSAHPDFLCDGLSAEDAKEIAGHLSEELGVPVEIKLKAPQCPYRRPPIIAVGPKTNKIYEGAAICSETGKFCLLDEGLECEEYNKLFEEL